MADGSFGAKDVLIDLAVTGARAVRGVSGIERIVKVTGVTITGNPGASGSTIGLRKNNASTGEVKFLHHATASVEIGNYWPVNWISNEGLYVQDVAVAWAAGSFMIIHTA